MKNNFGGNLSVLQGTSKVISSSDSDWSKIRKGSYIRIGNDRNFYTIAQAKEVFYLKDFECIDVRKIKIRGNIGINLMVGDNISVVYDEFELFTVFKIVNPGEGYKEGEILTVEGGCPVLSTVTNLNEITTFLVKEVDEKGGILQFSIETKGKYVESPPKNAKLKSDNGKNAEFLLDYQLIDTKNVLDRRINNIQNNGDYSILTLDYPLPKGLKTGNFNIKKWEILLSSNYENSSKFNEKYEILRDFSPHLGLPLLTKGSLNPEYITNRSLLMLDSKIQEIEQKIDKILSSSAG